MNPHLSLLAQQLESQGFRVAHTPRKFLTITERTMRATALIECLWELADSLNINFGAPPTVLIRQGEYQVNDPAMILRSLSRLEKTVLACYLTLGLGHVQDEALRFTMAGGAGKVENYQRILDTSIRTIREASVPFDTNFAPPKKPSPSA